MTIDRILLKINSDLGLSFYQSLAQCDTSYLLRFAKNNSAADDNFLALIQQFQKHQFVLKYNRTDVFIKSLVRIAQRVGIDINDSQALELMGKVDEIESYVKGGFTQLHLLFIKNSLIDDIAHIAFVSARQVGIRFRHTFGCFFETLTVGVFSDLG